MHPNIFLRQLVLGLTLLLTLACSQQPAGDASVASESGDSAAPSAGATDAAAASPASVADGGVNPVEAQLQSSVASQPDRERRFIRTASAQFRVRDVYRSALAIEDLVAAHGGFVASNDISSPVERVQTRAIGDGKLIELATYSVRGSLQVRVPGEKMQGFLRALAAQVEFLDRRRFEAVDAQFDLLRQQLAQQRAQQAQLALAEAARDGGKLGQKADAIAARSQALAGRDEALIAQRTFEDRVALATIDLSLYQSPQLRRTERVDLDAAIRREGPGLLSRIGTSLSAGWYGLLSTVVVALALWPLWLVLLAVLAVVRWWRKRRVQER